MTTEVTMRLVSRLAAPAAITTLAAAALAIPAASADAAAPPVPTSTKRCHDWTVAPVRVVGGGPHLLVSAVCAVRGNERLQIRRHNPQGINPANLLLELVVQSGPFP